MTDSARRWCRLYADIVDDERIRLLDPEDRWYFVALLACMCQGLMDKAEGPLLDRMVGVKLGLADAAIGPLKQRLQDVGLVGDDWVPRAWERRQYRHDSSAERVRKHRSKKRAKEIEEQWGGGGNGDVTLQERYRNGDVTSTDTENRDTSSDDDVTRAGAREGAAAGDSQAVPEPEPAPEHPVGLSDNPRDGYETWEPRQTTIEALRMAMIEPEYAMSVLPMFRVYAASRDLGRANEGARWDPRRLDHSFVRFCRRQAVEDASLRRQSTTEGDRDRPATERKHNAAMQRIIDRSATRR